MASWRLQKKQQMRDWPSNTFVGGHVVLDFLNTGGGDTKARDVERLVSYGDLLSWSTAAGLIDDNECAALASAAEKSPHAAKRSLTELTIQRESLYRYVLASMDGMPVAEPDRRQVEKSFHEASAQAQLVASSGQLAEWKVSVKKAGLSLIRFRLALAASSFVTDPTSADIRQCEMCSWFFLDSSASKRRRWCSMAVCGNRAKGQRHYHRNRESQKAG